MNALLVLFSAILVDNLFMTKLFGIESFFTSPEKPSKSAAYGGIVLLVTFVSGSICLALNKFVFAYLKIGYVMTFVSVLVITAVIALTQIISKLISESFYKNVTKNMPILSTNCVIIGSIMICAESSLGYGMSLLYLIGAGVGFIIALLIFSAIRERLQLSDTSPSFEGIPILLLSVALCAMAFSGFTGLRF